MIRRLIARTKLALLLWQYDEIGDLAAFYNKFKQPMLNYPELPDNMTRMKERVAFMQEELNEFTEGMIARDLPLMADALIDLCYVLKGTALELGLPWEALWQDVQRANMAKVIGETHRGIKIDVKKPPGWVPPKTLAILEEYGFGMIGGERGN